MAALIRYCLQLPEIKEKGLRPRAVKVGIIGTGWIAESHIESYKHA